MHVSNQLVSKWETGESVPSLEYIQELSDALQISVQELMGIATAKRIEIPVFCRAISTKTETPFTTIR